MVYGRFGLWKCLVVILTAGTAKRADFGSKAGEAQALWAVCDGNANAFLTMLTFPPNARWCIGFRQSYFRV